MKNLAFLAFCVAAIASEPIAKVGSGCPYGYRANGNYCIPNPVAKPTIVKVGNACPIGYHVTSGNYCIKN